MTGSFFGLPFSLPVAGVMALAFAAAAYCFWTARRALTSGVHVWRNARVSRIENPRMFLFSVGIAVFVGILAFAGGLIILFDLGIKA